MLFTFALILDFEIYFEDSLRNPLEGEECNWFQKAARILLITRTVSHANVKKTRCEIKNSTWIRHNSIS